MSRKEFDYFIGRLLFHIGKRDQSAVPIAVMRGAVVQAMSDLNDERERQDRIAMSDFQTSRQWGGQS